MKKKVIAYLHTHWDREWYREFEVFRIRLLRVFDNVLNLLEQNKIPSFYAMMGVKPNNIQIPPSHSDKFTLDESALPIASEAMFQLIMNLAKNDFKTKYAGSYLGIVWAFVQPIVTILVYWFVFSVGLKAGNVSDYPFVLYLVSGIVPWFFFQDALNGGTNALMEYNYLVKKVVFKISVLPIVKMISALFVHAFFVVILLVIYTFMGYPPSLYALQLIYYSFCIFMLILALTYMTSAAVVFFRDLSQIINIALQVGVWVTPIMWDFNDLGLGGILAKILKLNPVFYIVQGYRDSLINKVAIWQHPVLTLYFWVFTIAVFFLGTRLFKKLQVHFADVL